MEAPSIEVVDNTSRTAADFINTELASARSVFMASAFVKMSGLKMIADRLESLLKSNRDAGIVLGLDFYLTEPAAVRWLLRLMTTYPELTVRAFSDTLKVKQNDIPTFHPKLYIFQRASEHSSILAGSSNLTGGGLESNEEFNLGIHLPANALLFTKTKDVYDRYCATTSAFSPDANWLDGYEFVYKARAAKGRDALKDPVVVRTLKELRARQKQLTRNARTQKGLLVEAIRHLRKSPDDWVHLKEITAWVDARARALGLSFDWKALPDSLRGRFNEHTVGKGGDDLFTRKGGVPGREGMYKLSDKGEAYKGS